MHAQSHTCAHSMTFTLLHTRIHTLSHIHTINVFFTYSGAREMAQTSQWLLYKDEGLNLISNTKKAGCVSLYLKNWEVGRNGRTPEVCWPTNLANWCTPSSERDYLKQQGGVKCWDGLADKVLVRVFVNLAQAGVIWEEGTSIEEMSPPDWPVGNPKARFLDS